ncbi:asialoglycoprotein receptor 2-like [Diretmus argenteus]
MKRRLVYVLYGVPVLLLLTLLLVTGIKCIPPVQHYLEPIVPVRGRCDEGWVFFQSSCYLLSTEIATWSRAEEQCKTHAAHLLVVNNVEELDYISKIVVVLEHYWIGLVEREHEGHWTWVDGTDYRTTPTFWDMDQPDDWDYRQQGEDCAQLHASQKRKRKLWNDADCNLSYRYICEAAKLGH